MEPTSLCMAAASVMADTDMWRLEGVVLKASYDCQRCVMFVQSRLCGSKRMWGAGNQRCLDLKKSRVELTDLDIDLQCIESSEW